MQRSSVKEPPLPPVEGEPIFTLDGRRLGWAAEVCGHYFRLRRRFRRDLWIAIDALLPAPIQGRTVTRFGADVVHRYCLDAPPQGPGTGSTNAMAA
jgi:hypothetical protein